VELVDGHLVVNAAPAFRHQRIADRLQTLLDNAVADEGMEAAPLSACGSARAWATSPTSWCAPSGWRRPRSRSTWSRSSWRWSALDEEDDRLEKPAALAAAGVPAYWWVELGANDAGPTIYCYRLDGRSFVEAAVLQAGATGTAQVTGTVSVTFDPADLHRARPRH
jgi:hypothetical protein